MDPTSRKRNFKAQHIAQIKKKAKYVCLVNIGGIISLIFKQIKKVVLLQDEGLVAANLQRFTTGNILGNQAAPGTGHNRMDTQ